MVIGRAGVLLVRSVDTAVIRLVVRDELGGRKRAGSMEIRLPLDSNQQ